MAESFEVVAIVGSLRRESFTRRLVQGLIGLAPPALQIEIVGIGDLPLYNQDSDESPPAPWTIFRSRVKRADGVLFATPEYNRSVPGALKNAIDVGSRPYGSSVWARKPAAVLSASPGAIGGFGANHHLRQSLVFLDKLFDSAGQFANPATREFCARFLKAFEVWIRRHKDAPAS